MRDPRIPAPIGPARARGLRRSRRAALVPMLAALAACAGGGSGGAAEPAPATTARPGGADDAPRIVQPGAPGAATRPFDGTSLADVEGLAHTRADVAFMQGMIHHHAQALDMTALIEARTGNSAIRQMGLRMEISQQDEIALMERWLRDRGEEVPDWRAADAHAGHGGLDHGAPERPAMPGMLSPEQMARLEAASGEEFDRLFLELMIQHHQGALAMVQELFASPGAGQESRIFQIASEIDADQAIEIRRMRELLAEWGG